MYEPEQQRLTDELRRSVSILRGGNLWRSELIKAYLPFKRSKSPSETNKPVAVLENPEEILLKR